MNNVGLSDAELHHMKMVLQLLYSASGSDLGLGV